MGFHFENGVAEQKSLRNPELHYYCFEPEVEYKITWNFVQAIFFLNLCVGLQ